MLVCPTSRILTCRYFTARFVFVRKYEKVLEIYFNDYHSSRNQKGYEAYDFGSEAHEAISLLQGQLEVKLLDVGHGDAILLRNQGCCNTCGYR